MFSGRPTRAEIDLQALIHNFSQVKTLAGAKRKVLAAVKADAYGHGAVPAALALERHGADFLGVALTEEGLQLREAGIGLPILLLGGFYPGQEEAILDHRLTPILFDLESARRLNEAARRKGSVHPFHLKIDSGMGRVGFREEELGEALGRLHGFSSLDMEGVLSHLALSDVPDHPATAVQLERFRRALELIRASGFQPRCRHISNSAAVLSLPVPECNMVRPGIMLYGSPPSVHFEKGFDLRPVMSLRTAVAQLKRVPEGTGVSYGHRFVTSRPSLLAAIPIGYGDGYSRRLSNCGEVLIRGKRARVAGTVCMDWTVIDVTDIPGVQVGETVTLLGRDGDDQISAEEWAEKVGTISYEVYCGIGKRVPRVYRGG
ncbi:MAG: alanine racemase [Desulfuromonadaceae bacterium]|nr:alanine racemase [Desulfuromonadaceae bacterium]